jgi:uncharacterized RDD family membrane protein YckC
MEAPTDPSQLSDAGLARRLAAALYDGLLLIGLLMIAAAVWLPFTGGEAIPAGHHGFQLYLLAVIAAFWVGFWSHGGQTLGMRAWRLRLVRLDGGEVDPGHALARFPLALLGWVLVGVGVLWVVVDRQGRALHDRLSSTRVVVMPKKPLAPGP